MKPQRNPRNVALATLALVASSLAVGAGVTYAGAPTATESAPLTTDPAATTVPTSDDSLSSEATDPATDAATDDVVECDIASDIAFEEELTAEDFAAMDPKEQAAIVEASTEFAAELKQRLDDAGVAYTMEVDPVTGVSWPTPDADDPAAQATFDGWAEEGDFEIEIGSDIAVDSEADFEEHFNSLNADEKAALIEEHSQQAADFVAELDAAGVTYTMEVDPVTGVSWPTPDLNDPAAAELFAGDCEILTEAEFAEMFNGLSDEEKSAMVEQMTADAAALAEQLDAEGIEYTMEVDEVTGVAWPAGDCDDETGNDSGSTDSGPASDGTPAA